MSTEISDNLRKVYINSVMAGELDGSGSGMGESFWVNIISDTTAEVRNNCLCGLCVGDIIEYRSYSNDGIHHPREFVKVIKKIAEVKPFRYSFPDMENSKKFPKEVQTFIKEIEKKGIKFEGVTMGMAMLSCPVTMTEEDFREAISGGPLTFAEITD